MQAESKRSAVLTREPDLDNANVGMPENRRSKQGSYQMMVASFFC